jgi:hypothetical protein
LAIYDKDGKLSTAVRDAITEPFPKWHIAKDVYQVFYYDQKETADKTFKLLLENGDKHMRVKLNEKGEFI